LACTLVLAVAAAPAGAASPVPPPVPTGAPDAAATPGSTTTPPGSPPASPPTSAATAPDPPAPGWVPRVSRVPPATTALVTAPVTAPEPGPAPHVVVRGDTLWEIAAARLGPAATAAEIAAEWPRWWRANHAVVGDDPDLLRPGQVLHPPPPTR
ncbi:MAG: LysM peptidoglycan-binding domain-containing protein, partial [Kineosporiaceae bacterium]